MTVIFCQDQASVLINMLPTLTITPQHPAIPDLPLLLVLQDVHLKQFTLVMFDGFVLGDPLQVQLYLEIQ